MKKNKFRKFVRLPNGKQDSASFDRKTDAEAWFSRRKLEIQRLKALGMDHMEELTFRETTQKWYSYSQNINQRKTNREYHSVITRHLIPMFGDRLMTELRRSDGEAFVNKLVNQKLQPMTISKIYGILKSIIKHAVANNYLIKDPFLGVKTPKSKSKRVNFLTALEAEQLLEVSRDSEFYGIILITLNCGLRLGEVLGLCWDSVDLTRKRLNIARSLDRYGLKEHTKNGKHRELPMTEPVFEYLKDLKLKQPFQKIVFSDDGEFWNPDHFKQRHFDPLVKEASIEKCRFHDLRHTFATHYMRNNGNIFDLQKLLGHQQIENTLIYAHHSIDHLEKSAQVIQFGKVEKREEFKAETVSNLA